MKKPKKYLRLIILTLICVVIIDNIQRVHDEEKIKQENNKIQIMEETATDAPKENSYYATLFVLGQNLMNESAIKTGLQEDGTYNFDYMFEGISQYLSASNVTLLCQGSVIGGNDLGVSGYPTYNAPEEFVDSAVRYGVNMVAMANVRINSLGSSAIDNSINIWKSKSEAVQVLGIQKSAEERMVTIQDVNGLKIAFLNYTAVVNDALTDEDAGKVNFLGDYQAGQADLTKLSQKTQEEITYAQANSDFIVSIVSWGLEDTYEITNAQSRFAKLLTEAGVDLIIGNRPNYMQKAEWIVGDNGNKALCFYSLGNFVSSDKSVGGVLSGVAKIGIHIQDGNVVIDEQNVGMIPVISHYTYSGTGDEVTIDTAIPFSMYTDEMAAEHGLISKYGVVFSRTIIQEILDKQIGMDFIMQ